MFRRLASPTAALGILVILAAPAERASAVAATPRPQIAVVKVSGLIDPINADLVIHAVHDAEAHRALVLVVQLNSSGGVISRARDETVATTVRSSSVPVAVWVGGSSRPRALGAAFDLFRAAAFRGIGPSGLVGRSPPPGSGEDTPPITGQLSAPAAVEQHVADVSAPTLGDFIVDLDGRSLGPNGPLQVAQVVTQGGQPRREVRHDAEVAFSQLTVLPRILHSAASPNVAFVMLILALALAVFEFFTAGVGVAAAAAAGFGVLAAYGLGVLPTRPGALVLVAVGMLGFAIDVQSGAPRAWTAIGAIAVLAGSLVLFDGQAVSLWVVVLLEVLLVLFMVAGMPAMVRTRFSTPTIGREAMIGAEGHALAAVDPDGTVEINGAPWRARTNRATPISPGGVVRVVAIDGLVLEVEPESGGARDAHH